VINDTYKGINTLFIALFADLEILQILSAITVTVVSSGNTDYVIVGPSFNYLLKSSQCVVLLYVSYISIDTHHS
jgi:hypothetical protein